MRFASSQVSNPHYNYFRDYDPSTGRYVQSDPIGLAGGANTYGYVEGDPLFFIDEYGLSSRRAQPGGNSADRRRSKRNDPTGPIVPIPNDIRSILEQGAERQWSPRDPLTSPPIKPGIDPDFVGGVCVSLYCPQNNNMCSPNDYKTPDDFVPAAYRQIPPGCSCLRYASRYTLVNRPGFCGGSFV